MKLEPPALQYLEGDSPSHSSLTRLSGNIKALDQEEIVKLLTNAGHLNSDGKPTKLAAQAGVIDICDKKILWNLLETKKALVAQNKVEEQARARKEEARRRQAEDTGPKWVDLGTVGTYFGASNIVVGKWLDQAGLRAKPKLEKNESGDYDMLDIARQEQQKQITGFTGKQPTDKAYAMGLARTLKVTNSKKKEIDIVQWNLDLCKAVLVNAGHKIDHDRKLLLKGKGKNSDVKVLTVDDRAKELYSKWKTLKSQGKAREAELVFAKQPSIILDKVEVLMNNPGYFKKK
jgi:hypothetical protein